MPKRTLDKRSQQLLVASHEAEAVHGAEQEASHWGRAYDDAKRQLVRVLAGAGRPGETVAAARESVQLFEQRIASALTRAEEARVAFNEVVADVCERCGLTRDDASRVQIVSDADGLPTALEEEPADDTADR